MQLLGKKSAPRRAASLALPVVPCDLNTAGADSVYEHNERVVWSQNVKRDSRVHLVLRLSADGHVYVESVSVADVLDHEEAAEQPAHGREHADAPVGDTLPSIEVAPECTDALGDEGGRDRRGDGQDESFAEGHASQRSEWRVEFERLFGFDPNAPVHLVLSAST